MSVLKMTSGVSSFPKSTGCMSQNHLKEIVIIVVIIIEIAKGCKRRWIDCYADWRRGFSNVYLRSHKQYQSLAGKHYPLFVDNFASAGEYF